jgi:hypothetical protein
MAFILRVNPRVSAVKDECRTTKDCLPFATEECPLRSRYLPNWAGLSCVDCEEAIVFVLWDW